MEIGYLRCHFQATRQKVISGFPSAIVFSLNWNYKRFFLEVEVRSFISHGGQLNEVSHFYYNYSNEVRSRLY